MAKSFDTTTEFTKDLLNLIRSSITSNQHMSEAIIRLQEQGRVTEDDVASLLKIIRDGNGRPQAEDEDLFGTAVQMAARVCDAAEPGQILAANVVQELAAGKGFDFEDQGEATLKGFEKPRPRG